MRELIRADYTGTVRNRAAESSTKWSKLLGRSKEGEKKRDKTLAERGIATIGSLHLLVLPVPATGTITDKGQ